MAGNNLENLISSSPSTPRSDFNGVFDFEKNKLSPLQNVLAKTSLLEDEMKGIDNNNNKDPSVAIVSSQLELLESEKKAQDEEIRKRDLKIVELTQ